MDHLPAAVQATATATSVPAWPSCSTPVEVQSLKPARKGRKSWEIMANLSEFDLKTVSKMFWGACYFLILLVKSGFGN